MLIFRRTRRSRTQPRSERHPFRPRLMPLEAYPEGIDSWKRDELDRWLRPRLHKIPTVAGEYLDRSGDRWTLHEDGCWTDHTGQWRPASHNPLLSVFAPFEPA